ncbi:MAG TPA: GNAT family protein [Thermoplasmata archaeon]|nr:GNAT family protein [Thermoplasmata archaeon]
MTGNQFRPPVTLRGRYLELVPLERAHAAGLADAGRDPEVWRYLRIGPGHPPSVAEMETFIDQLLEFQAAGELLAFTMVLLPERPLVGIIRFLDIDRANQRVELGTWLDSRYWGSPLNAQAKLLMLAYAFEEEGVHRVQLKTDSRNLRSQRAIERLGAVPEGSLREAHLVRNDYFRTSLYYSILAPEWPGVKRRLEERLAIPWTGRPAE